MISILVDLTECYLFTILIMQDTSPSPASLTLREIEVCDLVGGGVKGVYLPLHIRYWYRGVVIYVI